MGIRNKYRPKTDPRYEYQFWGKKEGGKRLNKAEQDTFQRLFGASAMMLDTIERGDFNDCLKRIPRGDARLKQAFTLLRHLCEEIMAGVPEEQCEHMKHQLENTGYLTYVGRVSPLHYTKDMGRWMSYVELNWVAAICRHTCGMCIEDDPQYKRKCPINRIMNLLPIDKPATDSCGWLEVFGSLEG